jgi:very-short-patch-repair endonuclease
MATADQQVHSKLEASRKELLDLGLRNPLLNYRTLRSRGVEVVEELPSQVFRALVREGKSMTFLPGQEEHERRGDVEQDDGWLYDLPDDRHSDLKLQTRETPKKLEKRLLDTYYTARTYVEEQGVSILYLALGMLNWYEADASQEARRAPLILVPVELERSTARERFHLKHSGGEVGVNLSLVSKMKSDFTLSIPLLSDTEELDVEAYFTEVHQAVRGQSRWFVDAGAVALGFFSFGKFMMYHDLDVSTWPSDAKPDEHPVLRALLLPEGFDEPPPQLTEEDHLDEHLKPTNALQVVDADSTQTLAILDAVQGRNLVIQGPPGTGKSQTITNLIAEAIGRGKTVLFVAEKMAALEVVKRRLDRVGLGVACLELHSHKANKKELLTELRRTFELGSPRVAELESEINLLTQLQARINAYCESVNAPMCMSGITPYDAFGHLLQLRESYPEVTLSRIPLTDVAGWTRDELKRREALVEELQARLAEMGVPRNLAFWGSRRKVVLPTEQGRISEQLEAALRATVALREASAQLSESLGLPIALNIADAEVLTAGARRAIQSPHLHGIQLRTGDWQARRDDLRKLFESGHKLSQLRSRYEKVLIPDAWEQDLLEVRQHLVAYGQKWWRILSGTYRRARARLAGLMREPLPKSTDEQLAIIDAVLEARRHKEVVRQYESLGAGLFGSQWQGERSDWAVLARVAEWVFKLYDDVGEGHVPQGLVDFLAGEPNLNKLKPEVAVLESALAEHRTSVQKVIEAIDLDEDVKFGRGDRLVAQGFVRQEELLGTWLWKLDELNYTAAWNNISETCRAERLEEVVRVAEEWPLAGRLIVAAFRQSYLEILLEHAFEEHAALRTFDRTSHEEVIRKFQQLDNLLLAYNRARLATAHWQRLPQHQAGGQLGVLQREFQKRSRHLPIRQLIAKAGAAVQSIKPVFMMSPLSIANFIPPGGVKFDLVVFDEASQVKPVDAFGATLRARQAVVVGDSKQLPPTSFFDSLIKEEDVDEENVTGDMESVLGLFAAQGAPQRMLRWHYRSRHESLIAVSNQEFYDNRLVVFPSPDADRQQTGLLYRLLPETFYEPGKGTNSQEAEAVAQAVMEHARTHPELTLGVAAFSLRQRQTILDRLERMRREDSTCESFFASHPHEPFFVKNLENVQGDERDCIFISMGYGRTASGFISMNFGPLNRDGGERRLNVLITRARVRCEVFTNLTADDIDLGRTEARGVRSLKTFLSYAQHGRLDVPQLTGRGLGSPFEEVVHAALRSLGYQLTPQVGSAGFFIDLAVVDTQQPGRFLLGIECDGRTYHSARSARDRDRLRQRVLEDLGWRIHRVWSTDWFRNPERELQRVVAAVEEAKLYHRQAVSGRTNPTDDDLTHATVEREERAVVVATSTSEIPPYETARLNISLGFQELHSVPRETLAAWLAEVVAVEAPVHFNEAARRIAETAGVGRVGQRIRAALEVACTYASRAGRVRREGEFLWKPEHEQTYLRDRSALPASSRKLEFVADEEIALAILKAVTDSYGIEATQIPSAACKLLGFSTVSEERRRRVARVIDALVAERKLVEQGGHLKMADSIKPQDIPS